MLMYRGRLFWSPDTGPITPVPMVEARDLVAVFGEETDPLRTAVAEFERLERLLPDRFDAPFHRARALFLLGQEDAAREAFRASLACNPAFVPARILAEEDETAAHPSVSTGEPWVGPWIDAHRAFRDRRWDEAARAYGALLALECEGRSPYLGSTIEARMGRAIARLQAGHPLAAVEDLHAAQAFWPAYAEPAFLLAVAFYRIGQKAEARRILTDVIDRADPSDRDRLLYWIVATLRTAGDDEAALAWADRIERASLRHQIRTALLLFMERWGEAVEEGREAVHAGGEHALSHTLLTASLFFNSWLRAGPRLEEEARECLDSARTATALAPEDAVARACLALAHIWDGRKQPQEAARAIERALEMAPDHTLVLYFAGIVFDRSDRGDEALSSFRRGAEIAHARGLAQEEANCRLNVGVALRERGRPREAFEELKRAIAIRPTGDALSALGSLHLWWLRDPEKAEALYRAAIEVSPFRCFRYPMLARALHAQGRLNEALQVLDAIAARCEDVPFLYVIRGDALAGLQRSDEALACYLRALSFQPEPYDAARPLLDLLHRHSVPGGYRRLDPFLDAVMARFPAFEARYQEDPVVLSCVAMVFIRARARRDPARALEFVSRALERGPEDDAARTTLAIVRFEMGDRAEAVRILDGVAERDGRRDARDEILADFRREVSDRHVSYATVDARGFDGDPGRGADPDPIRPSDETERDETEGRAAAYFRARLAQVHGRLEEAEQGFRALSALDPESPLLWRRIAECLVGTRRADEAEADLRGRLFARACDDRDAWALWLGIALGDRGADPRAIASRLPEHRDGEPAPLSDARWLLAELASGRKLRILCGSDSDREIDGTIWSRDRLFSGGSSIDGPMIGKKGLGGREMLFERARRFFPDAEPAAYRIPLVSGSYRLRLHLWPVPRVPAGAGATSPIRLEGQATGSCDEIDIDPVKACAMTSVVRVDDGLLGIDVSPDLRGLNLAAIEIERLD